MPSSAVREMTLLHARELVRDRFQFGFVLVFPFVIMGGFLALAEMFPDTSQARREMVIPMALYLAVTSVAFLATAGPLTTMRQKGTLRLLGTTPLGRTRLLLTHMPVRLVLVLLQVSAVLVVGVALDLVEVGALPPLFALTALGLVLFGALGYLLGGVLPSQESAANIGTTIQLAVFFLSGLVFPLDTFPAAMERVLSYLPTTFYADLLTAQLPSGEATHPALLSVTVVAATTVLFIGLAVRTFKWDQGDAR